MILYSSDSSEQPGNCICSDTNETNLITYLQYPFLKGHKYLLGTFGLVLKEGGWANSPTLILSPCLLTIGKPSKHKNSFLIASKINISSRKMLETNLNWTHRVPQTLLHYGTIKYSPQLMERLKKGEHFLYEIYKTFNHIPVTN